MKAKFNFIVDVPDDFRIERCKGRPFYLKERNDHLDWYLKSDCLLKFNKERCPLEIIDLNKLYETEGEQQLVRPLLEGDENYKLSQRAFNIVSKRAYINNINFDKMLVGQFLEIPPHEFYRIRNCGKKTEKEIADVQEKLRNSLIDEISKEKGDIEE